MFVDDVCYVANVGDSRAIMAMNGNKFVNLTTDHKPDAAGEQKRIKENGGQVYKHNQPGVGPVGPSRILPGRLSVSFNKYKHILGFQSVWRRQGKDDTIRRKAWSVNCNSRNFSFLSERESP